jgi:hypothetical protein
MSYIYIEREREREKEKENLFLMFLNHTQRRSTFGRTPLDARLLRSWVRITLGAWIFVGCECCILSGRGLSGELITRPEDPTDCGASLCVI